MPALIAHLEAEYDAADRAHRAAFAEFEPIRIAYRAGMRSDAEFLAARAIYDAALAKVDAAATAIEALDEPDDADLADYAAARATLAARPHLLTDRPHPNAGLAARGRTMRDYAEWMLAHAGEGGRANACHEIEAATQSIAA